MDSVHQPAGGDRREIAPTPDLGGGGGGSGDANRNRGSVCVCVLSDGRQPADGLLSRQMVSVNGVGSFCRLIAAA